MNLSPRKEPFRLSLGERGEMMAWDFLLAKGFRILEKNYKCVLGEIDIVVEKNKKIIFIEVKTRTDHAFGRPEEAVHREKQRKLIQLAQFYLKSNKKENIPASFGVVAVTVPRDGEPSIHFIEDAFVAA